HYLDENFSRINLKFSSDLVNAGIDFFWLLERGYNRKVALDAVTARWHLSRVERVALYRTVFDSVTSFMRRRKLKECKGDMLAIDGFNVLSTVQSALIGDTLLHASDGFVRDLATTIRKVRISPLLYTSLYVLLMYVYKIVQPGKLIIVFDSQVSRSGEFALLVERLLKKLGLEGKALTNASADNYLIRLHEEYAIATSDSVLIDRADVVDDLGGRVASLVAKERIIELGEAILGGVRKIAKDLAERI
ncbi:MAG: DUF434 domain-containing protein, partial [Thermofilaceae archaeon]